MHNQPELKTVAELFGSQQPLVSLKGGRGTVLRSGSIILKPSDGRESDSWVAEVFSSLPKSDAIRIPKPVKSIRGNWVEEGYVAWHYEQGEHEDKKYKKKLKACDAYHALLAHIERPSIFGKNDSPWCIAEKVAWQEIAPDYDADFMKVLDPIVLALEPLDEQKQIIHGDMLGNFLFADGLPPAVIDFSLGWAPAEFSKGVMLVDAIAWFGPDAECVRVFEEESSSKLLQFALRGAIRRIVEQPEQVRQYGKVKTTALALAEEYGRAMAFITEHLSQTS